MRNRSHSLVSHEAVTAVQKLEIKEPFKSRFFPDNLLFAELSTDHCRINTFMPLHYLASYSVDAVAISSGTFMKWISTR